MRTLENSAGTTIDLEFEDLLNDDDFIDDFEFQYRMYLLQFQQQIEENLKFNLE